ncbi:MAG: hypothetical protein ACK55I_10740, partial [bacterium]
VKYGVPEKGMISCQSQLKPSDMQKVASYILTLKGTNPPNAKAPQGEIWKDESAAAPAATPAESGKYNKLLWKTTTSTAKSGILKNFAIILPQLTRRASEY